MRTLGASRMPHACWGQSRRLASFQGLHDTPPAYAFWLLCNVSLSDTAIAVACRRPQCCKDGIAAILSTMRQVCCILNGQASASKPDREPPKTRELFASMLAGGSHAQVPVLFPRCSRLDLRRCRVKAATVPALARLTVPTAAVRVDINISKKKQRQVGGRRRPRARAFPERV